MADSSQRNLIAKPCLYQDSWGEHCLLLQSLKLLQLQLLLLLQLGRFTILLRSSLRLIEAQMNKNQLSTVKKKKPFIFINLGLSCSLSFLISGRSWKPSKLRLKSWDDLNKLWYVLLNEKNMLMTQRQMLHAQNLQFPNPERIPKVRKSMCRMKHALTEWAIEEPDPSWSAETRRMINAL